MPQEIVLPRSIPMTGPWTFPSPASLDWYLTSENAGCDRIEVADDRGKAGWVRCSCSDGLADWSVCRESLEETYRSGKLCRKHDGGQAEEVCERGRKALLVCDIKGGKRWVEIEDFWRQKAMKKKVSEYIEISVEMERKTWGHFALKGEARLIL